MFGSPLTLKSVAITGLIVVAVIAGLKAVELYRERVFRGEVASVFDVANLHVEHRAVDTTENIRCAPSEISTLREWLLSTKRVDALVSWPLPTTDVFVLSGDGELKAQFQINDGPGQSLNYSMLRWNGKFRAGRRFRFQRMGS